MQPIEARILSVLRPGDMLRFVLRPSPDGTIGVEVEGAPAPATSDLLVERLQLILHALRNNGYVFDDRAPRRAHRSSAKHRRKDAGAWVSIRPRTVEMAATKRTLGFSMGADEIGPKFAIKLPDLPTSGGPRLFEYPASLVLDTPEVEVLEVEFVSRELPETWFDSVEHALRLHTCVAQPQVDDAVDRPSLTRLFLGLWLSHRSGWEVRVRAHLKPSVKTPTAILEIIGREMFACECEVHAGLSHPRSLERVSLGSLYPKGWPFPPILPSPELFDSISAERLHNVRLPRLPSEGLLIGVAEDREIRMPIESRDRHTYLVGATGTGKSTLLQRMICEDIRRGEGVILIDPHGDLYHSVLDAVPRKRRNELFLLDPLSAVAAPGLNILDIPPGQLRRRHADFLVGELLRFFGEVWDMRAMGGPIFEMYFRNTLLLMCMQGLGWSEAPLSIRLFSKVMSNAEFRKRLLANCSDKGVVDFWEEIAAKTTGEYRLENFVPYICSKVNAFIQGGFMAQLLGAERNEFRLAERMDRGEIILLNLNKGALGAYESRLLGTILMMEIFAAGLQRSLRPAIERRPVNIYVDEFQNFVSDNVASMLSEARKFGLRLTLANQTLTQLRSNPGRQDLLETVLGNVGNMILFRLGVPDSNRLAQFIEPFTPQQMQEMPNFHALTRLLTEEGPVRPLVMRTYKK